MIFIDEKSLKIEHKNGIKVIRNSKERCVLNMKPTANIQPQRVVAKPVVVKSFRLIDFHVVDDSAQDRMDKSSMDGSTDSVSVSSGSQDGDGVGDRVFVIQMFGVNERGETCSLYVQDFQPFFYIKVGDGWGQGATNALMEDVRGKVGKVWRDGIVSATLVDHYKLYGFSGGKKHRFVRIAFKNSATMNKVKNLWYSYDKVTNERRRVRYTFQGTNLELYESNIPPLLRYFHIQNISPSGWVSFRLSDVSKPAIQTTTCKYEYIVAMANLLPQPEKETRVPYKICSFDIEASSSHGDFPVPIRPISDLRETLLTPFSNRWV
jgi:DNA polymerase elongation subunit (family B)